MAYKYNPLLKSGLQEVTKVAPLLNYVTGTLQTFNTEYIGTNAVLPTNVLVGSLIAVLEDTTIDRLYCFPVVSVAGSSVWGLYELNPVTGYPTNLLFESVVNNGSATNQFTTYTPAKVVKKGIYFAGGITNSAATFQCFTGAAPLLHSLGVSFGNMNTFYQGYVIASVYSGTLPNPFPAGAAVFANAFTIKLGFRIG